MVSFATLMAREVNPLNTMVELPCECSRRTAIILPRRCRSWRLRALCALRQRVRRRIQQGRETCHPSRLAGRGPCLLRCDIESQPCYFFFFMSGEWPSQTGTSFHSFASLLARQRRETWNGSASWHGASCRPVYPRVGETTGCREASGPERV